MVWISAPVWTGTSIGALWVAWALVDAVNVIGAANGFACWVAKALHDTSVRQVGALVTALFGDVAVAVIVFAAHIHTFLIGNWDMIGAIGISQIVRWWTRTSILTVSMAGTVVAAFLQILSVAFIFAWTVAIADSYTLVSLDSAVAIAGLCFIAPDGFALV